MYVCVCNAITERQVRSSVESGSVTLADLQFDLGVATCCGSCAETACQYLPQGASGCEHAFEASITVAETTEVTAGGGARARVGMSAAARRR
ncbi:(2Fe-2S)-binding protein, partial [Pigmentiphaga humi]|uniref:(2Fe-2S)-binding protein n=1 Tax=Pigmentiphaga humi TaxID=2478468 RepID=UPI000F53F4AD